MPDDAASLTHLHPEGGVRMVDVGAKPDSARVATAAGRVHLGEEAFRAALSGAVSKMCEYASHFVGTEGWPH